MRLRTRRMMVVRAAAGVLSIWALLVAAIALVFYFFADIGGASLQHTTQDTQSPVGLLQYASFAVETTTTLGYGDYVPLGWFRILAGADALLGVVMAGLLVARITAELVDPLSVLKDVAGPWFDHARIAREDGSIGEFVTRYTIEKRGGRWLCSGTNFDLLGAYRHRFGAHIVGLDETTIYVAYHNDVEADDDYTTGVWVLALSGSQDALWYSSYSHDLKFGRRDESIGIKLHRRRDKELLEGLEAGAGTDAFREAIKLAVYRTRQIKPPALPRTFRKAGHSSVAADGPSPPRGAAVH